MTVYLALEQIRDLHRSQLTRYGGLTGLRDRGALEAAAARPQMTFGGEDLYPDLAAKAGAMLHSLVLNRPFVEGSNRVGAHAAVLFLLANGLELAASPRALADVTLATARGEMSAEALAIWFRQRSRPLHTWPAMQHERIPSDRAEPRRTDSCATFKCLSSARPLV